METLKAIGGFLFILSIVSLLFVIWGPQSWLLPILKIDLSIFIVVIIIFIFDSANKEE